MQRLTHLQRFTLGVAMMEESALSRTEDHPMHLLTPVLTISDVHGDQREGKETKALM